MDVSIDSLEIEIGTNSNNAAKGIDTLIKKLENLHATLTDNLQKLGKFNSGLINMQRIASGLKNIDIANITTTTNNGSSFNNKDDSDETSAPIDNVDIEQVQTSLDKVNSTLEKLNSKIKDTTTLGYKLKSIIVGLATSTYDAFKKVIKFVEGGIGKGFKFLFGIGKKTLSFLTSDFRKFIKTLGRTSLALLGVRGAFTAIRKAVSAYMAYDTELSNRLQTNWAKLGALLSPIIERLVGLFAKLVDYIVTFIKVLSGVDLVARANAKALKGMANELGNLAKFDELNVVDFGKNNNLNELDVGDIDTSKLDVFIKKLQVNDWYGLGMEIALSINRGLSNVDFDGFVSKATQWGKNVSDLFNGLIDGFEHSTGEIGSVFAKIINGVTGFITTIVTKTNWGKLGANLGNALTQAIKDINWEDVGRIFTSRLSIRIQILGNAISTLDWSEVGKGFYNGLKGAITNIPWSEMPTWVANGIKGGFKALSAFFASNENWHETGEKLRQGIINAFKKVKWDDVWETVKQGLKDAFNGITDFLAGLFDVDTETLEKIGKVVLGVGGALLVGGLLFKLFSKNAKDGSNNLTGFGSMLSGIGDAFRGLGKGLEELGKAAEIIAILGGIAEIVKSFVELIAIMTQNELDFVDVGLFFAAVLAEVAAAFLIIADATKLMDWKSIAGGLVIFGGMVLVLKSLESLIKTTSKNGLELNDVVGFMIGLVGSIVGLMGAIVLLGPAMSAGLVPFLAVVGGISAILLVMKATIPTILEAAGNFINTIAPSIERILDTIGRNIALIIYQLGTALPPIINSVGKVFTSIFTGIQNIIKTVGDVIVNIMNTSKSLIVEVLDKILWFVNDIGAAIENSVEHIISAVTKLINFIVSGVEYLINTAIIKPINKLINKVNDNAIAEKLGWQIGTLSQVEIDRFVPKLATGTNRIEAEGLYHLHKNEAVVPEKYNPAVNNQLYDETNNRLIDRIDRFMEIVENMEMTNNVYVGNERLYEGTVRYANKQNNVYGTNAIKV